MDRTAFRYSVDDTERPLLPYRYSTGSPKD